MKKPTGKQGKKMPMGMDPAMEAQEVGRAQVMSMSEAQMRKMMGQTMMSGEKKKKRAR